MIHFMRLRRDLKFLSHYHWPVDRLNNVSGSPVRPDLWPVLPVRIWWSIRPVWLWPVWSMIHCQLWDYRATTVQTSASARRISSKRWGGQLQLCASATPRPFFKSNISVADCMPLSSLLKTIKTRNQYASPPHGNAIPAGRQSLERVWGNIVSLSLDSQVLSVKQNLNLICIVMWP